MRRIAPLPYLVSTVIISIIYACLFGFAPAILDDPQFGIYMADFKGDGSFASWFKGMSENLIYRFSVDNGRLPNLFGAPLVILPKWLLAPVFGILTGLSIYLGARLADLWGKSFIGFATWVTGFSFLPAWYEGMYTTMYALNYLPSTVLIFACGLLILRQKRIGLTAVLLIGILSTMWHEMVGVVTAGGMLGILICFRQYRNRYSMLWLAALLLGMIYYFLTPATWERMGASNITHQFFNLRKGMLSSMSFYLFAAAVTVLLALRRTRIKVYTPVMAYCFGAALAGFVIFRYFLGIGNRTSWGLQIFVSLGAGYIVAQLVADRRVARVIALALLSACVIQPAACIPWAWRVNRQYSDIMSLDPGRTWFAPVITESDMPAYTLHRVMPESFWVEYYPPVNIIPEQLKDFNPASARQIGVGQDVWLYLDKYIVYMDDGALREKPDVNCNIYFDGKPLYTDAFENPFSNKYGHWIYARPAAVYIYVHLHSVTGFEILRRE